MPTSLQYLTNAISADLNAPQSQSLAIDLNPTPGEADVVLSYELFANTIEELMIDFVDQSVTLITVFNLKSVIYNQLLAFNTAFQVRHLASIFHARWY